MNKVILIGNVGATPEVKSLENGLKVATFSLATTETFTTKNGEKTTQAEWHKVEAWNGLVSVCERIVQKGDRLCVEGRIKTETWEDKDQNKRTTTKIVLQRIELLGNKREQIEAQERVNEPQQNPSKAPKKGKAKTTFEATDDLPF